MSHFNFDMSLENNFALFRSSGCIILVESFDNQTFDVRAGTLEHSEKLGEITASSSEELNAKLESLVERQA